MEWSLRKCLNQFSLIFWEPDILYWSVRYLLKNQVKTIPGSYRTPKFITAYITASYWALLWSKCVHLTPSNHLSKTHQSYVPVIQVIPPIFVCSSHHPQARCLHLCSAGVSQDVQVWPRMTATPQAVHVGMQTRHMREWLGTETLAPERSHERRHPSAGRSAAAKLCEMRSSKNRAAI